MKTHRAWIGAAAVAAMAIASFGGQFAAAQSQYGPYADSSQYPAVAPYATTAPYGTVAPYGVQSAQTYTYPSASYRTAATSVSAPVAQQPSYATPAPQYQPPQYQTPAAQRNYAMLAKRPDNSVMPGTPAVEPQSSDLLPTPAPATNGQTMAPSQSSAPASANSAAAGYYGDPGYGSACGCQGDGYGLDGYMDGSCDGGGTWFGGVYGLYMTRTNGPYHAYTAGVDTSGGGYIPSGSEIENESTCAFLAPHWRGGVEVRLGSTFGIGDGCDYGDGGCNSGCGGYGNAGGCDPCGCQPCCQPCCQQMYAWEVGWWGLDDDQRQQYVDGPVPNPGTFRYYGMINYAGLDYGGDPVNYLYNYQIPIEDVPPFGDTAAARTVLSQRVTTNFSCENLELNIMRLPLFTGGCGCDGCGPAFSFTGLCGVRYFRIDDDFGFDTEWATAASGAGSTFDGWGNGTNELFHDINVDNNLVGLQLGANSNYSVGARWNFFWDTNFGIYNNYISQRQRMYNPLVGYATFQDGRDMNVKSDKDDVAFLGEMRLGGGYLITPNWRGILAYRVIGVGGIARSVDQIRPVYTSWDDTARINSDGSMLIHGIQAGVECNY